MRRVLVIMITCFVFSFSTQKIYAFQYSNILSDIDGTIFLGGENMSYNGFRSVSSSYQSREYLYSLDLTSSQIKRIVQGIGDITFWQISTSGNMALGTKEGDQYFLNIFDRNVNLLKRFNDVFIPTHSNIISWSPDGKNIAYVTGKRIEEGFRPFDELGVYIYDIEKDETTKISDTGWDVNWSHHDGRIYIQNSYLETMKVTVYDPETAKLEQSKTQGLFYSDDGKYYLRQESKYGQYLFHIIESESNKSMFALDRSGKNIYFNYGRFISGKDFFISWTSTGTFRIIDVKNNIVVRTSGDSSLLGWGENMKYAVVYEGGNQIHIEYLLTGQRVKSVPLPKEILDLKGKDK